MKLKESTKRAIRTAFHLIVGVVTAIPVVVAIITANLSVGAEVTAILGTVVATSVTVSKILNALEEMGLIPAWLRDDVE